GLPPFQGGAVGFLGYELGRHLEKLPPPHPDDLGFPDMVIGVFDTVAAFDHGSRSGFVLAPDRARANALAARLREAKGEAGEEEEGGGGWTAEVSRAAHEAKVRRVIDLIEAGDVIQVNVAQRFLAELPARASQQGLYRRLRALSPAPFGAWVGCGAGRCLLSASPERFLRLWPDGRVQTRPIKGTRPRGTTAAADAALARELDASAKDRAENLMIVDLLRNDLSRVCAVGSVTVPSLCRVETFAAVHHLVSVVEGRLRSGLTAIDLLRATFPGGSVTGAPKIRAMEIIHELEPWRRGPYCGAVVWIGDDGAMDSSIAIRTLIVSGRTVAAHAGGGIVADSAPADEYDETMVKASALLRAVAPR
ncbi:MAG: aminodeoxychorismate synthase component I, partial [Alphaproteobacteria bacterium]|nr:aminodeoxychorismate synthase component I [Alphaproteobacteria bacterium]